jgi:hypothetical protein
MGQGFLNLKYPKMHSHSSVRRPWPCKNITSTVHRDWRNYSWSMCYSLCVCNLCETAKLMLIAIKVKTGPVSEIAFYKVFGLHMCIHSVPDIVNTVQVKNT